MHISRGRTAVFLKSYIGRRKSIAAARATRGAAYDARAEKLPSDILYHFPICENVASEDFLKNSLNIVSISRFSLLVLFVSRKPTNMLVCLGKKETLS